MTARNVHRIYLSGPMSGWPDLNFPAFHAAAALLRGQGFEVVNPAEINPDATLDWHACMRADIKASRKHEPSGPHVETESAPAITSAFVAASGSTSKPRRTVPHVCLLAACRQSLKPSSPVACA